MFVGSLVAAIAATIGLIFLLVLQETSPPGPPPGQGPGGPGGPGGGPHAPALLNGPGLTSTIVVAAALFTIAWVAVIAAAARDHLLREANRMMSEYGELRETEGYLSGYRQGGRPEAEVRQLHPVRPID